MRTDRALPYVDHTGNIAAANVDRERRAVDHALDDATAQHVMERLTDRHASTSELVYLFRTIGPALRREAA